MSEKLTPEQELSDLLADISMAFEPTEFTDEQVERIMGIIEPHIAARNIREKEAKR